MANILLHLPCDLIEDYERESTRLGLSLPALLKTVLEQQAACLPPRTSDVAISIADEPIVKAAEIEAEYRRLEYEAGWRFITCPQAHMASAKLLLVTLNPGGRLEHGPSWSQEAGSSYIHESWNGMPAGKAPLQRQIQAMFSLLGVSETEVFSAHLVPFRSASWADLAHKPEALAFSMKLWRWLTPQLRFDRLVCVGKDQPAKALAQLFDAKLEASLPVGWGAITADRYRLPDGRQMIALPHLSRFSLFERDAGREHLVRLFEL